MSRVGRGRVRQRERARTAVVGSGLSAGTASAVEVWLHGICAGYRSCKTSGLGCGKACVSAELTVSRVLHLPDELTPNELDDLSLEDLVVHLEIWCRCVEAL